MKRFLLVLTVAFACARALPTLAQEAAPATPKATGSHAASALESPTATAVPASAVGATGDALRARSSELGAREAALRAQHAQQQLYGPITIMALGYGGSLVVSFSTLLSWFLANQDNRIDTAERRVINRRSLIGLAPFAVGVGGSVWLLQRVLKRSSLSRQVRGVQAERRELLLPRPELVPIVGPQGMGLGLHLTF